MDAVKRDWAAEEDTRLVSVGGFKVMQMLKCDNFEDWKLFKAHYHKYELKQMIDICIEAIEAIGSGYMSPGSMIDKANNALGEIKEMDQ